MEKEESKLKRKFHKLGAFEMSSNSMRVSDPCYDKEVWCCGIIPDCIKGEWETAVVYKDHGEFGVRVSLLAARHAHTVRSFALCGKVWADEKFIHYSSGWEICNFNVGVDSGQAGLFDEAHYHDIHVFDGVPEAKHDFRDVWYNHCCDQTLGAEQAGTIPFGVVSSSGYGDGEYTALCHRNARGQADCVMIVFLADIE